jgi:FtsH-binding integral membrane protein
LAGPRSNHPHWRHYDRMFVYSALACLAASVLGGLLLRYAFTADPADTGVPRKYAVDLCYCLILSLPLYLLTLKSSRLGAIAMWALTVVVAALATMAGAFGLATPIVAVLIFAASIATSIWHKHKNVVIDEPIEENGPGSDQLEGGAAGARES